MHDAALVYRLVDAIDRFCSEQQANQSYLTATTEFFNKVLHLARLTKTRLQKLADEAKGRHDQPHNTELDDDWYENRRSRLLTIKDFWKVLHKYLKPAADADTLRVPAPLIEFAAKQVQTISGMEGATLTALLTPELNYFQSSHTSLKVAANALKSQIPEATWPSLMGFVELPYSQGPSFFTNILLYHEIGHFVFEELFQKGGSADGGPLYRIVYESLEEVYGQDFTGLSGDEQSGMARFLLNWALEIFCDVFAIRLIGPAFSLASVEMFSLLGLLDESQAVRFSPSHPAPACRYAQHLEQLGNKDAWWDHVRTISGAHAKLIEELASTGKGKI